jgi:hypothetical protein
MPRGRPFPAGVSGNPTGRKPGVPTRLSLEARRLVSKDGAAIIRKTIEAAKAGDVNAARLFYAYLLPRSKIVDEPPSFETPKLDSSSDVPGAIKGVLERMAAGELTAGDATAIVGVLEAYARSSIYDGHEQRLAKVEAALEALADVKPIEDDPCE